MSRPSEINHRSAVRIESREDGKLIHSVVVPASEPGKVFAYIGQALGALSVAMTRKQTVAICICKPWQVFILQKVLRWTK